MTHKMHCQEPWFSLIKSGKKPVEGRKASQKYLGINIGDTIRFYCGQDEFYAEVIGINKYDSLENYLRGETVERALPGVKSVDEGIKVYLQWSTHEQINKHGFLGIQVKVK